MIHYILYYCIKHNTMTDQKEKTRQILVRDIPQNVYDFIIDEQIKTMKKGDKKSLSAIIITILEKAITKS